MSSRVVFVPSERRVDIQILRGVAVLAVMLSHFGGLLNGGFLGVDLFFVLSGFVISASLLRMIQSGNSATEVLKKFWTRRFWRLFPALSVVLTLTIILALAIETPHNFSKQLEMLVWSIIFAGNIGVEIVSQPDYFDPAAQENFFLHLWSLGVEEQFYLFFPVLVVFFIGLRITSRNLERMLRFVVVFCIASFVLACANDLERIFLGSTALADTTGVSAVLGFYSPLTRAWEFGIGVVATLVARLWRPKPNFVLFALGAASLFLCLILYRDFALLPGPVTVVPVASVFLLLVYARPISDRAHKFFFPLSWLGDRSYSAYLWHWPVWILFDRLAVSNTVAIFLSFGLTVVLAHCTFELIETPLRDLGGRTMALDRVSGLGKNPKVLSVAGSVFLVPLLVGGSVKLAESVLESSGLIQSRTSTLRVADEIKCSLEGCPSQKVDVLLVGDSHAGALANALADELSRFGIVTNALIRVGCPHTFSVSIKSIEPSCAVQANEIGGLLDSVRPNTAVLFGYTAGRFTDQNSGGRQEIPMMFANSGERVSEADAIEAYELALRDTIDLFVERDIRLLIIENVPDFEFRPEEVSLDGDEASMLERLTGLVSERGASVSIDDYNNRHDRFNSVTRFLASKSETVQSVAVWGVLCEARTCYQKSPEGLSIFSDQDHLGSLGSMQVARAIGGLITK